MIDFKKKKGSSNEGNIRYYTSLMTIFKGLGYRFRVLLFDLNKGMIVGSYKRSSILTIIVLEWIQQIIN
jgi:hypothetical protein